MRAMRDLERQTYILTLALLMWQQRGVIHRQPPVVTTCPITRSTVEASYKNRDSPSYLIAIEEVLLTEGAIQ